MNLRNLILPLLIVFGFSVIAATPSPPFKNKSLFLDGTILEAEGVWLHQGKPSMLPDTFQWIRIEVLPDDNMLYFTKLTYSYLTQECYIHNYRYRIRKRTPEVILTMDIAATNPAYIKIDRKKKTVEMIEGEPENRRVLGDFPVSSNP